jgi:myo-inositol 2-dehydrogenase/D-chiro-inositol 1-dehydrogenase
MIKVGIIGMGRIGKVHCKSITYHVPGAVVKSVADPRMDDETRDLADGFGIVEIYDDYRRVLADPDIDAVLICSSTDTHADISIEAARAGKHIFCEKPVDTDPARIRAVISAVEEAGVKFQVGFNRRFDNNFKAIHRAMRSEKIGNVHLIRVTSRDPAPPPAEYVAVSGGMFLDMTIHDFDMVRYLSGSEALEVYAAGAVLVDPAIGDAGDIDTAVITIKLENGAIATIDNSRKAVYGYDQRAEVFGSKGAVSISNNAASTAVYSSEEGVTAEKPLYFFLERYMQSFSDEICQFCEAIQNDTETPVGPRDGLEPVRIALAAKRSLDEGRPVKLSEIQ